MTSRGSYPTKRAKGKDGVNTEVNGEPSAKRAVESHSSESFSESDENSSNTSEESDIPQEVVVNFKAVPPEKRDRNGVVSLLKQSFRGLSIDLVDLADVVLQHADVGYVLILEDDSKDESDDNSSTDSSEEEEDLYALSTIIPLSKHVKNHSSISSLLKVLASKCSSVVTQNMVTDPSSIGLLINERMLNIPASVVKHSFPSLRDDFMKSASSDPAFAKIKNLILISKTMKSLQSNEDEHRWEFANQEEEELLKVATKSAHFKVAVRDSEDCTLLGGTWNDSDSDTSSSNSDSDSDAESSGSSKKNEYASYRHVLLLPIEVLSIPTSKLFPGVSD